MFVRLFVLEASKAYIICEIFVASSSKSTSFPQDFKTRSNFRTVLHSFLRSTSHKDMDAGTPVYLSSSSQCDIRSVSMRGALTDFECLFDGHRILASQQQVALYFAQLHMLTQQVNEMEYSAEMDTLQPSASQKTSQSMPMLQHSKAKCLSISRFDDNLD